MSAVRRAVFGTGSATTLGGAPASAYLRSDVADTATGLITFAPAGAGIEAFRIAKTNGFFSFYDTSNTTREAFINTSTSASAFRIRSEIHGWPVQLEGENNAGTLATLLVADPDDSVDLYHSGAKVVETASSGINFGTGVSGSNRGRLTNNGTDTFLISDVNSGKMQIQSKSSGGVGRNLAILDPDGAATLYHAGTARLATTSTGISISGGPTLTYEEGTWTPTLTFATPGDLSVAYNLRVGEYEKVGRTVTVRYTLSTSTFTHTTASGNLQITGLPFTSGVLSHNAVAQWQKINATNMAGLAAIVDASGTVVRFNISFSTGATVQAVTPTQAPSGGTNLVLQGEITYRV